MSRYSRQMILPEFGALGQKRLAEAHILMVGAGGLGTAALQYLLGAGVGQITLIDGDHVAMHNLHRQTLYGAHIGKPKVEAAADFAKSLNPEVGFHPIADWLAPDNAAQFIAKSDLVLDCADRFAVSYMLSDHCKAMGKPLISASALGFSGYVGGFCANAPTLRAVFPDLPDHLANCDSAGVSGPVVGILGLAQAQMAIAHLLGLSPSPLGQLMRFDMSHYHLSSFRFDGAVEPETYHRFIAPRQIRATDLVVELRGLAEQPRAVTPRALRSSVETLSQNLAGHDPRQGLVLCCHTGLRAWRAAEQLQGQWQGEIALLADQS